MKKSLFYLRYFLFTMALVELAVASLGYFKFISINGLNYVKIMDNPYTYNFSDFFFLIRQNIFLLVIYTIITIFLALIFHQKAGTKKKEDNEIFKSIFYAIIESFFIAAVVFVYISRGMQTSGFAAKSASLFTMFTFLVIINSVFIVSNKKFLKRKLILLFAVVVSFTVRFLANTNAFISINEYLFDIFAINFFISFVYIFYYAFDKTFPEKTFSGIIYLILGIILLSFLTMLVISAVYLMYFFIFGTLSGFSFGSAFKPFFLQYLTELLKKSLLQQFTVTNISEFFSFLWFIAGIMFYIIKKDKDVKDKKIDLSIIKKKKINQWIIGAISIVGLFAILNTNKNYIDKKFIANIKLTGKPVTLSKIDDKIYILFKQDSLNKEESKIMEFKATGYVLSEKKIPPFDDFLMSDSCNLILFKNDKYYKKIILTYLDIKTGNIINQKTLTYDALNIYDGDNLHLLKKIKFKDENLFVISNYANLIFVNNKGKVYWKLNSIDNTQNCFFPDKEDVISVRNIDSMLVIMNFSGNNCDFILDLYNKKIKVDNKFGEDSGYITIKKDTTTKDSINIIINKKTKDEVSKIVYRQYYLQNYVFDDNDNLIVYDRDSLRIFKNNGDTFFYFVYNENNYGKFKIYNDTIFYLSYVNSFYSYYDLFLLGYSAKSIDEVKIGADEGKLIDFIINKKTVYILTENTFVVIKI